MVGRSPLKNRSPVKEQLGRSSRCSRLDRPSRSSPWAIGVPMIQPCRLGRWSTSIAKDARMPLNVPFNEARPDGPSRAGGKRPGREAKSNAQGGPRRVRSLRRDVLCFHPVLTSRAPNSRHSPRQHTHPLANDRTVARRQLLPLAANSGTTVLVRSPCACLLPAECHAPRINTAHPTIALLASRHGPPSRASAYVSPRGRRSATTGWSMRGSNTRP